MLINFRPWKSAFNVKYALIERPSQIFIKAENDIASEGVRFSERSLRLSFGSGSHYEMAAGGAAATELVIISAMSDSAGIIDGAPVLRFKLHTKEGRIIERELQAGRDTSEWAYDRADVGPIIKHARARDRKLARKGQWEKFSSSSLPGKAFV